MRDSSDLLQSKAKVNLDTLRFPKLSDHVDVQL